MHDDRTEALRYLYSYLCHLEQLAVLSVERGNGVEGQLEDELRHVEIFRRLAEDQGGLLPATAPCEELTRFCSGLHGTQANIVLNIVAEHWLETIFKHLVHWVDEPEIQGVLEDEARHVAEAPLPSVRGSNGSLIRELERRLHAVASDPEFMYPLCHLAGAHAVSAMAADIHRAHEESLRRLGENPGDFYAAMVLCRQEVDRDREPRLVPTDAWRETAFNLNLAPMIGWVDVPWHWSTDPLDVEARVVRATGRTLRSAPQLHRTINPSRREVYRPRREVVGVRRRGHPGVVSVAVAEPSEDLRAVARDIRRKHRRALATAVEIPPHPPKLHRLQPKPRMSAVVTNLMGLGGITFGLAPLNDFEGAVWSVGVGGEFMGGPKWYAPWRKPTLRIGVYADHRAVDGVELCEFLRNLRANLGD